MNLKDFDPEIWDSIHKETHRQENKLELIASENFVSKPVREAVGSILTNKYAEGYPGNRYYGGCEYVDIAERLAIDRAKQLYGAEHINVQPHSGSQANAAVYFAMLEPEDTILGMDLEHGGHLSHGSTVNISGKYFNAVSYRVDSKNHIIDYEEVKELAHKNKPKLIIAGASAYPRIIDFKKFRQIADEVGAYLMVDMAHIAGLIAAGLHPNPVEYADFVTTTTHKTLRGPRGGMILCAKQYTNTIDKAVFPGTQGGPLMHVIAAKGVCFKEALQENFKNYQKQIVTNAQVLAQSLIDEGFDLVSGGTDNHIVLVDLQNKNITGKECEQELDEIGITCNKNAIPFDVKGPSITSGIRLGTPAVTTRGMGAQEMQEVAKIISKVVSKEENYKEYAKTKVKELCEKFSLYNN